MFKKLLISTLLATVGLSANAATLRFATNTSNDIVSGHLIQEFADRVREETDNRVRVRIFWNGSLGSQQEYLQQIQTGIVDFGLVGSATLENIEPSIGVLNMPFLFDTVEDYGKVMNSEYMRDEMYHSTAQHGFTSIGYISNGFRSLISTKPISSLDDMSSLKIRSMDSRSFIDSLNTMGVSPIPMNFGDVYPGMQQGIIDGADLGLSSFWDLKYGEIANYGIRTEHVRLTDFIVMSERVKSKISEGDLATIKDIMFDVSDKSLALVEEDQRQSVEKAIENYNVEIIDVDKAELASRFNTFYARVAENPATKDAYNTITAILEK